MKRAMIAMSGGVDSSVAAYLMQRAPTPGQAVVLYDGELVLGGGTIVKVEK